jgi:hypothetical protein
VSQRGSRPARHSSATRPNAASAVVRRSWRRSSLRTFRPRWTPPVLITGRGSGDHQATQYGSPPPTTAIVPSATRSSYRNSLTVRKCSSGAGIGMKPRRYAPSTLAGLRSAHNATGRPAGRGPSGPAEALGGSSSDSQSG